MHESLHRWRHSDLFAASEFVRLDIAFCGLDFGPCSDSSEHHRNELYLEVHCRRCTVAHCACDNTNCSEFGGKGNWSPNSPDLSPLEAMLARYHKPTNWNQFVKSLPHDSSRNCIKKLQACIEAVAEHFERVNCAINCVVLNYWSVVLLLVNR